MERNKWKMQVLQQKANFIRKVVIFPQNVSISESLGYLLFKKILLCYDVWIIIIP